MRSPSLCDRSVVGVAGLNPNVGRFFYFLLMLFMINQILSGTFSSGDFLLPSFRSDSDAMFPFFLREQWWHCSWPH
jgi:hypothetical protein